MVQRAAEKLLFSFPGFIKLFEHLASDAAVRVRHHIFRLADRQLFILKRNLHSADSRIIQVAPCVIAVNGQAFNQPFFRSAELLFDTVSSLI